MAARRANRPRRRSVRRLPGVGGVAAHPQLGSRTTIDWTEESRSEGSADGWEHSAVPQAGHVRAPRVALPNPREGHRRTLGWEPLLDAPQEQLGGQRRPHTSSPAVRGWGVPAPRGSWRAPAVVCPGTYRVSGPWGVGVPSIVAIAERTEHVRRRVTAFVAPGCPASLPARAVAVNGPGSLVCRLVVWPVAMAGPGWTSRWPPGARCPGRGRRGSTEHPDNDSRTSRAGAGTTCQPAAWRGVGPAGRLLEGEIGDLNDLVGWGAGPASTRRWTRLWLISRRRMPSGRFPAIAPRAAPGPRSLNMAIPSTGGT